MEKKTIRYHLQRLDTSLKENQIFEIGFRPTRQPSTTLQSRATEEEEENHFKAQQS